MWALGLVDLMVATHASAFASIGRAEAAQRVRASGGKGAKDAKSYGVAMDGKEGGGGYGVARDGLRRQYVVARDGMCFPWPRALGGAPMSRVGSHFEDTSCNKLSKVLDVASLYRGYTRALTF